MHLFLIFSLSILCVPVNLKSRTKQTPPRLPPPATPLLDDTCNCVSVFMYGAYICARINESFKRKKQEHLRVLKSDSL